MKEFLESQAIPAAITKHQVVRLAKLRLPGGEIAYPTHLTIAAQKSALFRKIKEGDLLIELMAPIRFTKFVVDKTTKAITETEITIHGRQISLHEIRSKLLREHEELGLTRFGDQSDNAMVCEADSNKSFDARKIESDSSASLATKQELLQASIQQRYPKVWDDHGPIAGRGHIKLWSFSLVCMILLSTSFLELPSRRCYTTLWQNKITSHKTLSCEPTIEFSFKLS